MKKVVFPLLVLLVVVVFGVRYGMTQAFPFRSVKIGDPVPDVSLKSLDGKTLNLKDIKGLGVILFWGADSALKRKHSLKVLEGLKELSKKWKKKVTFVAVNAQGDSSDTIRKVIQESGYSGSIYIDPERRAYSSFGVFVMPSVVIIQDGIIKAGFGYTHNLVDLIRAEILVLTGVKTREEVEKMLHPTQKQLSPQEKEALRYYNLGKAMVRRGMLSQAEEAFKKAVEKWPRLPGPFAELARIKLKRGDIESAEELAKKALSLDPQLFEAQMIQVEILASLGKLDEAIAKATMLSISHPGSPDVYEILGDLYRKKGNWEKAAESYKKAIRLLRKNYQSE